MEDVITEQPVDGDEIDSTEHPVTDADPEGDGLDKGQATADVHGDVLGI